MPTWATDLDGGEPNVSLPRWLGGDWAIPEISLPRIPIPIQPTPPIPPAIPGSFSTPKTPTLPPGQYQPVKPGTIIKPTIGVPNLPKNSLGEIDWEKVGQGIDMTDTKTWPAPPFFGNWQEVDPPAGTKSADKATRLGHKRLQNDEGDVLRPHMPDKYHPKWDWDLKKGGSPNNPWENYTPDGTKIPDGKIFGKDFNPVFNPFSVESLLRLFKENQDKKEYQDKLKQYNNDMKNYNKQKQEYENKRRQYYKDHPETMS